MLTTETKKKLVGEYKKHDKDTGSEEVQAAILTADIKSLTEHAKIHKHDYSSKRGLLRKVNRRRKLMAYIKSKSEAAYKDMVKRLGLRK